MKLTPQEMDTILQSLAYTARNWTVEGPRASELYRKLTQHPKYRSGEMYELKQYRPSRECELVAAFDSAAGEFLAAKFVEKGVIHSEGKWYVITAIESRLDWIQCRFQEVDRPDDTFMHVYPDHKIKFQRIESGE